MIKSKVKINTFNTKMSDDQKHVFKVLLLGDSTVGKTCFLMRFTENTFQEIHMSTIGLDYRFKKMTLENQEVATVQIWDTAGQDRFRAITKNYYKGAHGILLIYDVTNQKSFDNVKNWVGQIRENASEKAIIYIVGNKVDDTAHRVVSKEQGEETAKEFNLKFYEASAKEDINKDPTFQAVVNDIYKVSGDEGAAGGKLKKGTGKKGCCS